MYTSNQIVAVLDMLAEGSHTFEDISNATGVKKAYCYAICKSHHSEIKAHDKTLKAWYAMHPDAVLKAVGSLHVRVRVCDTEDAIEFKTATGRWYKVPRSLLIAVMGAQQTPAQKLQFATDHGDIDMLNSPTIEKESK